MDEGPILDGKGRFRHWMENFSDKDFLDECSKERDLKDCTEVCCGGSEAFCFPEPFPRILLFSSLWLSSWNVKRESFFEVLS